MRERGGERKRNCIRIRDIKVKGRTETSKSKGEDAGKKKTGGKKEVRKEG